MAFGINRQDLKRWKREVQSGKVALITHYWYDERFPQYKTVTKAGCANRETLISWGEKHGLRPEWIHDREPFPHFDLIGERESVILESERTNPHAVIVNVIRRS